MKVLKPYNVTNDRLDEVSNYYRYQPHKGELWPTTAAEGYAVIEDGKIKKIVVAKPGAGYSSPPKVTVKGYEKVPLVATVEYVKDLKKNGAIKSIEHCPRGKQRRQKVILIVRPRFSRWACPADSIHFTVFAQLAAITCGAPP